MLSLGLSCALRPALSRTTIQAAARSRVQPFSTNSSARFAIFKNAVQKHSITLSPLPLYGSSRTIITDAQTVSQASSQDAWKKFAITAVRSNGTHLHLLIQVCRPPWQALSSLQKAF